MRRISANYIFPVDAPPIRNGIVETDDEGTITDIYNFGGEMRELAHTEFINGVLVPGLINMHNHLEFAWQQQVPHSAFGIDNFIEYILTSAAPANNLDKIIAADEMMYSNGTVAVCDVANTDAATKIKAGSSIKYHTFVELMGLKNDVAKKRIIKARSLLKELKNNQLSATLAPHSPYSLSSLLWRFIEKNLNIGELTSMHNQESNEENILFKEGDSKLSKKLLELNLMHEPHNAGGKSSIQTIFHHLKQQKVLLVHNTFTSANDIDFVHQTRQNATGWVLCPTSNYQITGQLPDISLLQNTKDPIMLGTDSAASAVSLSLFNEMKFLQKNSQVHFSEILRWATLNAADFMQWKSLGSLTIGKKPGLNIIEGFDFENMSLKPKSKIRKIL